MVLAGVVLAAALRSVLRQQRTTDRITAVALGGSQLAAASALVPSELATLSASAGDLVGGQAHDTAFQLRASIAAAVACDTAVARVTISSDDADELAPHGAAASVRASDSLWWYAERGGEWTGRRITGTTSTIASCRILGMPPLGATQLALDGGDTIPAGAPVRITRQLRYGFYRGGDGSWQLGVREWSDALKRFTPPQPLAGPFAAPRGGGQTGFRYFDEGDTELVAGETGVDVSRVARIRVSVALLSPSIVGWHDNVVMDSVDVAIAHRL